MGRHVQVGQLLGKCIDVRAKARRCAAKRQEGKGKAGKNRQCVHVRGKAMQEGNAAPPTSLPRPVLIPESPVTKKAQSKAKRQGKEGTKGKIRQPNGEGMQEVVRWWW